MTDLSKRKLLYFSYIYLFKAKSKEFEAKQKENKLFEENLKCSKLEDKFQEFKEKASSKLAKTLQKYIILQSDHARFCFIDMNRNFRRALMNDEFSLFKVENEKKITQILALLEQKQDQIDSYLKEKK